MISKSDKILLAGVSVILLLYFGYSLKAYIIDRSMIRSWRGDIVGQLGPIGSYDEVESIDLGLGSLLGGRDDSWILVGYKDTHRGRILSLAIAKTKDGRWFESDRHFCGAVDSGRRSDLAASENQSLLDQYPDDDLLPGIIEDYIEKRDSNELWKIGKEPDQEKQVQMLIEAGFWEIDAP